MRPVPLPNGVEVFLGVDEPKPTGVRSVDDDALPAPDRMLDERRTDASRGESSESSDRFEPAREVGREPELLPARLEARFDWRRVVNAICSSVYGVSNDCRPIGRLRSDFSLIC